MADEQEQQIRDNISAPKRVQGDAGSVEQHALKDQIEADRYLASKAAARRKGPGVRIAKMVPPGSA
jgi:hypothetical protein